MELIVLAVAVVSLILVIVMLSMLSNIGTIAAETKKIRAILLQHHHAAVQAGTVKPAPGYNPPPAARPTPARLNPALGLETIANLDRDGKLVSSGLRRPS